MDHSRANNLTHSTNWFRRRRNQLDLTMQQIAERVGVTISCVQNWEWDRSAPRANQAREVAKAYEKDLQTVSIQIVKLAIRVKARGLRRIRKSAA